MRGGTVVVIFVITFFVLENLTFLHSLTVTFRGANVTYLNKKHAEYATLYTKRYGRKSLYYLNLEAKKNYLMGNNVTFHMVFYEYLHNEYRRSFVEMHVKLCDMMANDILLGQMVKKYYKCPIVENELRFLNVTTPSNFPFKFPFDQFRVDVVLDNTEGDVVARAELFVFITKH